MFFVFVCRTLFPAFPDDQTDQRDRGGAEQHRNDHDAVFASFGDDGSGRGICRAIAFDPVVFVQPEELIESAHFIDERGGPGFQLVDFGNRLILVSGPIIFGEYGVEVVYGPFFIRL